MSLSLSFSLSPPLSDRRIHQSAKGNFFILVPCFLLTSKSFIHQQMHYLLILENSKIYIKISPTCFGPRPPSGSLHLSLAKVTLTLKQSVKLRRYILCGGVAACYVQVWRVCAWSLKCSRCMEEMRF
jgi:hypothetical protein